MPKEENPPFVDRAFKAIKDNPMGYGILAVIVLWVAYWAFTSYLGPKQPGTLLERSSYERNINVLVYANKSDTKNYYVPGDVTRGDGGYTISSVTWPNGGESTFDDCQIYLYKRTECTISNSKESQKIVDKMVNDKNYSPSVQELLNEPSYFIQLTSNPAD